MFPQAYRDEWFLKHIVLRMRTRGQTRKWPPLPSARGISSSVVFPPIPDGVSLPACFTSSPSSGGTQRATCPQGDFPGSLLSPS